MVRNVYTTLFLLLVILPQAIFAGTLKGKVTDSKGEPLPFATIYIKGTTIGTAANANADYSLVLQPGTYKVLCQYMGFEQTSYNVIIKGNEEQVHNFSLQEQSLKMENVVVKANAEDPAYAIIRKAIKRRKFHQEQVRAFQTSIYMKTVARNTSIPDKILGIKIPEDELEAEGGGGSDSTKLGVIILSEQEADYYTQGKKERTVIRAVRQSGNPDGLGLPRPLPVVSFYDNNVNPLDDFSERGFISPRIWVGLVSGTRSGHNVKRHLRDLVCHWNYCSNNNGCKSDWEVTIHHWPAFPLLIHPRCWTPIVARLQQQTMERTPRTQFLCFSSSHRNVVENSFAEVNTFPIWSANVSTCTFFACWR